MPKKRTITTNHSAGEKPESYKPPVSIPLPSKDAVRGLMQVDFKKPRSKQAEKKR